MEAMVAKKVKSGTFLKICCGVVVLLLFILIVVLITLFFTLFKPKNPKVTTHPTTLENLEYSLFPKVSINATIVLNVTVSNHNHGSFTFKTSIANVYYRGTLILEIPIEQAKILARGNFTITAYANVTADKMAMDPNFDNDIGSGHLSFTCTAILDGKISVLKIIKKRAEVTNVCDVFVDILTKKVESTCHAKVKM
ncbi:uncharacterized protein [Rutidosis leptorrhynchoides]|uniref:uncharacterized protein n=1 Tax=Rutidosis leptorrhynchoides TaxID=125765 RepID=UPI003A98E5E8